MSRRAMAPQPSKANRGASPAARSLRQDLQQSVGQPMDQALRTRFEARPWPMASAGRGLGTARGQFDQWEHHAETLAAPVQGPGPAPGPVAPRSAGPALRADFGQVRVHRDAAAARATARLGAAAVTWGSHIYLGQGQSPRDAALMGHELAHVCQQQAQGQIRLQPRLLLSGNAADIQRFLDLAEAATGESLSHDATTGEVQAIGSLPTAGTSAEFSRVLHAVMDDPAQDAELNIGVAQPRVLIGAFPTQRDMLGDTLQDVDIDDIENLEAGAPGSGLALLAHEMAENYVAHGVPPTAGTDQFPNAHRAAARVESDVAEEVVGPGRRVAEAVTPLVANVGQAAIDYQNYYLVFTLTQNPATQDVAISNSRQANHEAVATHTIAGFTTGQFAMPAAGAATVTAAAADVAANPLSTVRVDGFTDDVGTAARNSTLSRQRALAVAQALVAAGVASARIHIVGHGADNPQTDNSTEANRSLNRRAVIQVDRPQP